MKHLILRYLILLSFASFTKMVDIYGQEKSARDLIGKWENIDEHSDKGGLNILDSANVIMTMMGREMPPASFKADFSKNPIWFDIIIKMGSQEKVLKGLIRFENENTLKWEVFPDGNRPKDFSNSTGHTAIILNRKSK